MAHGLSPTIATRLSSFSSPENAPVAIITMMWVRQRLVAVVVTDVDPLQSISRPHSLPAVVVVGGVVGHTDERKAMETMMEEAVMEEGAMEAELRPERSMRSKEAGAAEVRAYHASGARA